MPDIAQGEDGDSQIHMYADDTTIYVAAPTYDLTAMILNKILSKLYAWCCENRLTPHPGKTEFMLLSRRQFTGPKQAIKLGCHSIYEVCSARCLGVVFDNQLKWDKHLLDLTKSFSQKLNLLRSLDFLPRQARVDFYFKVILPGI